MSLNVYRKFIEMLPQRPLQVGTAMSTEGGQTMVELPSGGILRVRGVAAQGQRVFVRDDVIEGNAPQLPIVTIEI